MPNAAPPPRTHPSRATTPATATPPPAGAKTAGPASTTGKTATAPRQSPARKADTTTAPFGSLPTSWGSAGALLLEQTKVLGERAPINSELVETAADAGSSMADLSAIWTLPEQPGRGRGRITVRRMDDKGRISLPLTLTEDIKVNTPAEADGPILTIFLPGSSQAPAASRLVAPLPLDARGRLTIGRACRGQLAWHTGAELVITYDAELRTLTLAATAVLEDSIVALLGSLRPSQHSSAAHAEAADEEATTSTRTAANVHYLARQRPSEPAELGS